MCARARVVADNRVMKERERKKDPKRKQMDKKKEDQKHEKREVNLHTKKLNEGRRATNNKY